MPKKSKAKKSAPKMVAPPEDDGNSSDYGSDMLEMIEDDDLDFIKTAITSKSYSIFNRVRYSGKIEPKTKKRKIDNESDALEDGYEADIVEERPMKNLLPIKTNKGLIRRQIELKEEPEEDVKPELPEDAGAEEDEEDDEEFDFIEDKIDLSKPVSNTELLVEHQKIIRQRKVHIGTLSAGLLENPEEKVTNLRTLLELMDGNAQENFFIVRKLALVSLSEVFKDILPGYEIKNVAQEGVKLKKDTLKLTKYEEVLLLYYKKYLQKLEKISGILIRKLGDTRKFNAQEINLAYLSVKAMCELLVAHPYFNYSQNLAQAIVPFLNNSNGDVRSITKSSIITIFKEDKKEEITLKILRSVSHYLKTHSHNVRPEMLEIFLSLNLKNVNLDAENERNHKEKKLNKHKSRVLQLSKKERKRKKKLEYLEKELLETKAEESKKTKEKNLAEITKVVFGVYFRILKNSEDCTVLDMCLEGLAKFSHCINIEFYLDLVAILEGLLEEEWITTTSRLRCIRTVFAILSGQGEVLNVDPNRFYRILYQDLIAPTKSDDFAIVLGALNDALVKRRRKITVNRHLGFVKRLATLSLNLSHDAALATLGLVKSSMQSDRKLDVLLDTDTGFGDGRFDPELDDPEYANAACSALYETTLLAKHYHPVVRKYSANIAAGLPTTGRHCLEPALGKRGPEELFKEFCMDEMAFNPAVPLPKNKEGQSSAKRSKGPHVFVDTEFEAKCRAEMTEQFKKKSTILH